MPSRSVSRFLLPVLLLVLAAVTASPSGPAGPAVGTALEGAIGAQVAEALRNSAALGVHVVELKSGATVYAYSPDEPRIIASNTKLLTTAAALDALGPGWFFETRLLARGRVREGNLEGDLGVVGGGDPNISGRDWDGDSYAVFRGWARELASHGIRRVEGGVFLDHGLFRPPRVHPDWPREQLGSWYEAPVDALSFSDNCILVRVSPGRAGGRARVETVPPVPLFQVENGTRTVASRKSHHVAISREERLLRVTGSVWQGSGPFESWVTVPDPAAYFGSALVDALREEGIEVRGGLHQVDRLPGALWERIAVYRTDLLSAVRVANKRSQNFYAESLVKQLGARRCGEGSWREGVRAVREFVVAAGVPRGAFRLADGSGMSRENLLAPRHLTQVLRHMWFHPAGLEFVQSLPFGGEDNGSWKRRLAAPPYRGNVFAKTGTLDAVSALSGYARAVSGKIYAFSILFNRSRSVADARRAQDRIVMALIDHG